VVALDYSTAVDACYANLRSHDRLAVVQGDIYALPFAPASFDFVYSLGVLQHTPDVARAFAALPPMVRPGGRICVDFYEKSWKSALLPKYWLRPFTKRMSKQRLFALLEAWVPRLLPVSALVGRVPFVGGQLKRIIPVANYIGSLDLDDNQQLEWSLLDTFDWLSPEFDSPQTAATVRAWLMSAGLEQVEVLKAGHLVGRAVAPAARA
jgi:SAM-dependent methyltransferase